MGYALLVDGSGGIGSRWQAQQEIDKVLNVSWVPRDKEGRVRRSLRDTWGTSPQAVEGQRAMMDLFGGPAASRGQDDQEPPG